MFNVAGHEFADWFEDIKLHEDNSGYGSYRHGQEHTNNTPEHTPERQGQQDSYGVELHTLALELWLEEVADEHLNQTGQEEDHNNSRKTFKLDNSDRQRQQRGDKRANRWNEIQQEGEYAKDAGQLQLEQGKDKPDENAGDRRADDL